MSIPELFHKLPLMANIEIVVAGGCDLKIEGENEEWSALEDDFRNFLMFNTTGYAARAVAVQP